MMNTITLNGFVKSRGVLSAAVGRPSGIWSCNDVKLFSMVLMAYMMLQFTELISNYFWKPSFTLVEN